MSDADYENPRRAAAIGRREAICYTLYAIAIYRVLILVCAAEGESADKRLKLQGSRFEVRGSSPSVLMDLTPGSVARARFALDQGQGQSSRFKLRVKIPRAPVPSSSPELLMITPARQQEAYTPSNGGAFSDCMASGARFSRSAPVRAWM
ncbi:hypothetical protein DENSPDRAFT_313302 [Dentipellis sp. KUC8613]|nr:hypothetical protein DENSPDRAFT_313302 [Dentipellis sp. KUC8613]